MKTAMTWLKSHGCNHQHPQLAAQPQSTHQVGAIVRSVDCASSRGAAFRVQALVMRSRLRVQVTTPDDMMVAENLLNQQRAAAVKQPHLAAATAAVSPVGLAAKL